MTRGTIIFFLLALAGCARFEPRPLAPARIAAQLETRSLNDPVLRAFVETNLHRTFTEWPPKSWEFSALTLAAFYFHPELDVARAQWHVAQAGVQSAGGRPNPTLSAVPGYSLNPASGVSPWFPGVTLDIPIETAGKRDYRIAQAQGLSEAARLNIVSAAWRVRSDVRSSLLDYAAATRRAGLLQRQSELQQQIIALLEQRLQAGAIARNELTPPRLALAKAGADLADATRQAAEARVRLAEALGLPAKGMAGAVFDFSPALDAGTSLTTVEARQQALLGRADLLAALAEYSASQSALQLEIAKQYPDVHLSPGYQFDQGEHKWTLGLSVELPVLNQNQGPIAEAQAKREEAAARFVSLQARIIAGIDRALAAHATAVAQAAHQNQMTRLADEQRAAVEAQFNAGAADRLDWVAAQLEASAMELAILEAQSRLQQAVAQLEDALQCPLEAWPNLERGRTALAGQEKP